ncbi:tripartite motif containing 7 L homeolog [Xenopus laevis]|uniref:RING finger protein n=1 Tax=Xenopus laevis TaxID=8355 RepID=Q91885_XENLA|nr:tripartite motif containing 7 L homeolog [Xenopus laevis]AAB05873.1 RING finger protein [Xenopus laevis]
MKQEGIIQTKPSYGMASADLREDLSCSICLSIYTEPVMLPCGHNFCQGCIVKVLETQEGSGGYTCPECREEYEERPALHRNWTLGNIAEKCSLAQPEPGKTEILCTYCDSPVPAVKSCLQCETSLCNGHLQKHNKSVQHTLTEPTCSFMDQKCSTHSEIFRYHCCEDSVCICVSCCLAGEHRGHRVELLSEASEKKKEKLGKVLEKLTLEREEAEREVQGLQEDLKEKAAGETERVTVLFRDIRKWVDSLEKQMLDVLSRQKEKLSRDLCDVIQNLEIKQDELSGKIRHIEELCNMADPLVVLQERESHGAAFCGAEAADDTKVPSVRDLDKGLISDTLVTGLAEIMREVRARVYGQEAKNVLLDISTAGQFVSVSQNKKTASESDIALYPDSPDRFKEYNQVLCNRSFKSGQHYWEVEGSTLGDWDIGVAYPSIKRDGKESGIGNNMHSWSLCKCADTFYISHNFSEIPVSPSCHKYRISLDYEAGLLSFYELSKPARHLYTFTASFTEPLHPVFYVGDQGWVRICK